MHSLILAAATAAGVACWLFTPGVTQHTTKRTGDAESQPSDDSQGRLMRYRWPLCLLCGAIGATVTAPPLSWMIGIGLAVGLWFAIGRASAQQLRDERAAVAQDLVPFVGLFASALESGAPPVRALEVARLSLPGLASDRLAKVSAQLELGSDPQTAWKSIAEDPALAQLGNAVARAELAGAPIASTMSRLADELAHKATAEIEDRARAVGVQAAVPLGLCLLPSFLLIGIVPVAAGLLSSLS